MPPDTEVIKQQMGQTRASLTEKLETLEQQVVGTVRDTTHTVADTAHDVRATVHNTVQDVSATVRETMATIKDTFDVARQMNRHPWLMLGSSVFVGYLSGRLLERVEGRRISSSNFLPETPAEQFRAEEKGREPEARATRSGSSFLKALADTFGPEISKLKRIAVGATLGMVRDKLTEAAPDQLKPELTDLMNRITVKLGGEPTPPGSISIKGGEHEKRNGSKMARSLGTVEG